MKKITLTAIVILFLNCAATKNYLENRIRDSGDIFHIGIEKDVYGASVFVDSIGLGMQHAVNGKGIGMRYGTIGFYKTGNKKLISLGLMVTNLEPCVEKKNCFEFYRKRVGTYTMGNSYIGYNSNYHEPFILSNRTKSKLIAFTNFPIKGFPQRGGNGADFITKTDPENDNRGNYLILPIEVSAGLYLGVRFGFNISEFADFLVGFIGFDPLGDDIAGLPQPSIIQNKDWENLMNDTDESINLIKTPIISYKKSMFYTDVEVLHRCEPYKPCKDSVNEKDRKEECTNQTYSQHFREKCVEMKIIAFCQIKDEEIIYEYEHGAKSLDALEKECKSLKGKFVK